MANKKGIKSQRHMKKGFARSYYDPTKVSHEAVNYTKLADSYYLMRGSKNRLKDEGCEQKMLTALVRDAYSILFRRCDPTHNTEVRLAVLRDIHDVLDEYGKRNILYVDSKSDAPKGAVFFPYNWHLCLTREEYGMPFEDFLRCMLGENFADQEEKFAAIESWTHIPRRELRHIYLSSITAFIRDRGAEINRTEREEESPALSFRTHCDINITTGVVNFFN